MDVSDGRSSAVDEGEQQMTSDTSTSSVPVDTGSGELDVEHESLPDEEASIETLPLDQVFEILKNQRRRYVLQCLKTADEPVEIGALSEQLAAWENDKELAQISSSERKRVYVGLYQCHLPKMDGMDIVEFNKPRGVVELGPRAEDLDRYLEFDDADQPPWPEYFVALSLGGCVLLAGAVLLQTMLATPLVTAAAGLVVGSFLACSLGYFAWERTTDDAGTVG